MKDSLLNATLTSKELQLERWKDVVGFDGYEVSDLGRVRSWFKSGGRGSRADKPRLLKLRPLKNYPYLRVGLTRDNRIHDKRVHRLVLEAFVGPCPEGMECSHADDNKYNNRLVNLSWDTRENNLAKRKMFRDEFGRWSNRPARRPTWDEYGLAIAAAAAIRGDCIRSKVGSCLMDEDHTILGTGFNGSEPGGPSCIAGECPRCWSDVPSGESYESCIEIHSEDNCLRNSREAKGKTTMYITRAPCYLCEDLMRTKSVSVVKWPEGELKL